MLNTIGVFGFRILVLAWVFGALQATPASDPFSIEKRTRQLFFDKAFLEETENVVRTVHQPKKHPGNPVLVREHPWEGYRVQVYGTVLFDPLENLFKVWYMNIPKTAKEKITVNGQKRPGHATLLSYATSKDGIVWDKPLLNLVDYEGSKANNMIAPDLYNPEGFSVLFEPGGPDPKRRYKAFYWDHGMGPTILHEGLEIYGEGEKDGMHVAFSPDGIHWTSYKNNPVMKYGSDTGQVVLFDPNLQKYVAFGRFGAGGRKVARTESEDFIHWATPELVLEPDEKDGPNTQFYGVSVDLYQGVYIGVLWMFYIEHTNVGRIDFQLCHSRDGRSWIRDPNRTVFLPNGPEGAWDHGDMRGACRSVILDDRVLLYYAGSAADHGRGGELNIGMDIGMATLRRDGWVSLDAGKDPGMILTKPFVHPGGALHVNLDSTNGMFAARYLDAEGKPFSRGYPSKPVTVDSLDLPIDFKGGLFRNLQGKTVRLQFMLERAKFHSFWFE